MNGAPFRGEYRELSTYEKSLVRDIKEHAERLYVLFNATMQGRREIALAKTKLEEAVMWAVKGVTG